MLLVESKNHHYRIVDSQSNIQLNLDIPTTKEGVVII